MMRHLLDIETLSGSEIEALLALAVRIDTAPQNYAGLLSGQTLINLFYEASTRTRVSFETAAKQLGAQVINISTGYSSVVKGETLSDTFLTLQAMAPDFVVVRHPDNLAPASLVGLAAPQVHLVNAGDGNHAHPTQALTDALTLFRQGVDFSSLSLLIAGDIKHSRVAASNIALWQKLGVKELRLFAPPGLEPDSDGHAKADIYTDFEAALTGVQAVMMLRIQHERIAHVELPGAEAYHRQWGLTAERLRLAAEDCWVMHPGPMNREVEIATEVADGRQSLILQQVSNGVAIRRALLAALAKPEILC